MVATLIFRTESLAHHAQAPLNQYIGSDPRMKPRVLAISGVLAGHIVAGLLVARLAKSTTAPTMFTVFSIFGLGLSQACLVPLWFALSRQSRFWRLTGISGGSIAIALYLFRLIEVDVGAGFLIVVSGVAVLITGLLARLRGCRIQSFGAMAPTGLRSHSIQFSVAELMGVTALVAVAVVATSTAASALGLDSLTAAMLLAGATGAAATCWATAWAVLGRARLRWRFLAIPGVAVIALASSAPMGLGIAILLGVEAAIIGTTLLPLRYCGYGIAIANRHSAAAAIV
jgi:hypothetical protein